MMSSKWENHQILNVVFESARAVVPWEFKQQQWRSQTQVGPSRIIACRGVSESGAL